MPRLRIEGKKIGDEPGSLIASPLGLAPEFDFTGIGDTDSENVVLGSLSELADLRKRWPLFWLNVVGVGDADMIGKLGEMFGLHRLALEDVLNVHQRPKCDEYDEAIFFVSRLFHTSPEFKSEQISMFIGDGWVITFQERPGDWFEPVRQRVIRKGSRLRHSKADYLGYALLDATVDGFFPLLEAYGDRLEELEDAIMIEASQDQLQDIRDIKRELLAIRRTLWSLREALAVMQHTDHALMEESTTIYIRDAHDHAIQLLDIVESYRELAASLVDIYLSAIANRNAEVGKVLTVVATIFLPLTFLVGLYGMNFNPAASPYNMPELNWRFGYLGVVGFMLLTSIALVWYFARKGWLKDRSKD